MTEVEFKKLIARANEVHRKTLEMTHYVEIPKWWLEELKQEASDDNEL